MARAKKIRLKPTVLMLLEGWGIAPAGEGNAITSAKTPTLDKLASRYPTASLIAAGEAVGLPAGHSGGSRVGHVVIGTGQVWQHSLSLVNEALGSEDFNKQEIFETIKQKLEQGSRLHFIGLLSSAVNEASFDHLRTLIEDFKNKNLLVDYFHCILDGRDASPTAGQRLVAEFEDYLKNEAAGKIATLLGRSYALDEKYNFARLEKARDSLILRQGKEANSTAEAISDSYEKKIFDEEFAPTVVDAGQAIGENDVVVFWNHSGRSIIPLLEKMKKNLPQALFVSLNFYGVPEVVSLVKTDIRQQSIGSLCAAKGLRQLRLSDSAGFPGVASWLDGVNDVNEKVDRKLVPTRPELSIVDGAIATIKEIKKQFNEALQEGIYDFIAVTFSQPDFVSHNADFNSVVKVIEELDETIGLMIEALELVGGGALVVGTHGSAERLIDPVTGLASKEHSSNNVPLYLVGAPFEGYNLGWPETIGGDLSILNPIGSLIDIAPTILYLLDIKNIKLPGKNLAVL